MNRKLFSLRSEPREPSREPPEAALLKALRAREPAALGQLFDQHQAVLYRFIARLEGVDRDVLDDLVQTSFLEALRSVERFSGDVPVRSWLIGIAVNVVRHHVRGEVRFRLMKGRVSEADAPASTAPDEAVMRSRNLQRLEEAIRGLPLDLRAAYLMCAVEEIRGEEAAKALSIPEGTLYRRLHEARRALKLALGENG